MEITIAVILGIGIIVLSSLFYIRSRTKCVGTILALCQDDKETPSLLLELDPNGLEKIMVSDTVTLKVKISKTGTRK